MRLTQEAKDRAKTGKKMADLSYKDRSPEFLILDILSYAAVSNGENPLEVLERTARMAANPNGLIEPDPVMHEYVGRVTVMAETEREAESTIEAMANDSECIVVGVSHSDYCECHDSSSSYPKV